MTKFNTKTPTAAKFRANPAATRNHEGGLAFKPDAHTELYLRAASCLVGEPKFYESGAQSDNGLREAVSRVLSFDPEFVLKLALYCRSVLHLRSVPLFLLVEYANQANHEPVKGSRKYVASTIQRADELSELIALQFKAYPREKAKLPMVLKHGIREAFGKFDEYQLAKYNRGGDVRLRDALFLTHPKPADSRRTLLYDKLANDTLEIPETWEVMRSTGKMTWSQVVNNVFHKGGKTNNYMALVRNLRNIMQSDATKADIKLVCQMLTDDKAVRNSKLFPFRYLSAYREIEGVSSTAAPLIMDSLEKAASISIENVPHLDDITFIAGDVSGSMDSSMSKNSKVKNVDIALVLSMMAHRFCDQAITGVFGTSFKTVNFARYSSGILANVEKARQEADTVGWSTNGHEAVNYLINNRILVNRMLFFTDCQLWDSRGYDRSFADSFTRYRQQVNPECNLYCFDLSGYGTVLMPPGTKGVYNIGGWSERVFDFIKTFEETDDTSTVINIIRAMKP